VLPTAPPPLAGKSAFSYSKYETHLLSGYRVANPAPCGMIQMDYGIPLRRH
jgi:hypothetical protein